MVQIVITDNVQSWRDLPLPTSMVAQLERAEELVAAGVEPWECDQADSGALMLHFRIAMGVERHQAGVRLAHVAVPDHVVRVHPWSNAGTEDAPEWTRTLEGPRFEVGGDIEHVVVEGTQSSDGVVQWGVRVVGDAEDWMAPGVARCLAGALIKAAGALENMLAGSASEVAAGPLGGGV
ncbi:Uncharacterised protein [Mycobacteroides abscessus subsp. abscessus]|uniref:hypothetical protein n=1 Tax=Mycobacteroides abscessus TaxID=36809 RepID=UPI0009260604|nr:hypothetical protein [Mycobacteroides abscessus]SHU44957.1 Uncharacterised protein [Mycobacteroides abscessus subsp. abscessus]SHZ13990.1 Uncharacterised protein [Mycobacteroides abscessus subsp. abscessus]SKP31951.1 Uncharacterised protein [Mycobacteroides abscessus subsp. abscessus]